VKASLLRWSVASLLSLFVATTSVQSAYAAEDTDEPAQSTGSKAEGKHEAHKTEKKARKKPAAKPKKTSKKAHKSVAKKKDAGASKDKKGNKEKSDKKDKLPALAKGVKQHDDAKPAAQSDKDTGKTTHRNRKKVRRRQAKQQ